MTENQYAPSLYWCDHDSPTYLGTTSIQLDCHFPDGTVNQRIEVCHQHYHSLKHTASLNFTRSDEHYSYSSNFRFPSNILTTNSSMSSSDTTDFPTESPLLKKADLVPLVALEAIDLPSLMTNTHLPRRRCQLSTSTRMSPRYIPVPTDINTTISSFEMLASLQLMMSRDRISHNRPSAHAENLLFPIYILLMPKTALSPEEHSPFLTHQPLTNEELDSLRRPIPSEDLPRLGSPDPSLDPLNYPRTRPSSFINQADTAILTFAPDPQAYEDYFARQPSHENLHFLNVDALPARPTPLSPQLRPTAQDERLAFRPHNLSPVESDNLTLSLPPPYREDEPPPRYTLTARPAYR
jgi:hypothetical protein